MVSQSVTRLVISSSSRRRLSCVDLLPKIDLLPKTRPEVNSGTTTTNTLSYDGDGRLLYESVTTTTPQSTKTNYLIHSTVLGTMLTKLDALGNKDITYVPTNGLTFSTQTKDFNGNPVVGGALRDATGLQEDGLAVDPFGARVRNVQPPDSTEEQANSGGRRC